MDLIEKWVESYLYSPSLLQKTVAILLLPLSLIYCFFSLSNRLLQKRYTPEIPVISIGNLTLGGSGKTPVAIELARDFESACVLLRGYGRESRCLVVVSHGGEIKTDVKTSGDEALLIAKSLPSATVIVSEDRIKGIKKAVELGCRVLFLDDGFRHNIKKFDILLEPKDVTLPFCLPSGVYREAPFLGYLADMRLKEGVDFKRVVTTTNPSQRSVLITAIANPTRLDPYLPELTAKHHFKDHHFFTKDEVEDIFKKSGADSILCTQKDAVKLEEFRLPLSVMELRVELDELVKKRVTEYLKPYHLSQTSTY